MRRVIVLAMLALFVSQCESGKLDVGSEEEKPTEKVDNNKVADLSFADGSELNVEVREKFDITVNVKNIDFDNLDDDLDWKSWLDDSKSFALRAKDLQLEDLRVTLKVVKNGTEQEILKTSIERRENGVTKFTGLYVKEVCASGCQIIVGLKIYGHCVADGGCDYAQVESVDEISKAIVITKSSYAAQVERLSGKNIKLTITKDGKPLADSSAKVSAGVECQWTREFFGCQIPLDTRLIDDQTVTLDANGSWSAELDADGSWEQEAIESYKRELNMDYTLNVCEIEFDITVDGRYFDNLSPTGGGC